MEDRGSEHQQEIHTKNVSALALKCDVKPLCREGIWPASDVLSDIEDGGRNERSSGRGAPKGDQLKHQAFADGYLGEWHAENRAPCGCAKAERIPECCHGMVGSAIADADMNNTRRSDSSGGTSRRAISLPGAPRLTRAAAAAPQHASPRGLSPSCLNFRVIN